MESDKAAAKRQKVLNFAVAVFLKYGYHRVTMQELADAAGISRPALYLMFRSKEEIFCATLDEAARQREQEILAALPSLKTPQEKIRLTLDIWMVRVFDLMIQSPEARELVECSFVFAGETLSKNYARLEAILASIVQECPKTSLPKGVPGKQLARFLTASVRGFKQYCGSSAELQEMIDTMLKAVFR